MDEDEHPFKPGVEVALVTYGRWDNSVSFTRVKVAKVHKSGRFVLEGSTQQYRANYNYWDKIWNGHATGDSLYSPDVELITPYLLKRVKDTERRYEWRNTFRKLERHARIDPTPEMVAAAAALLALLEPKDKTNEPR